MIQIEQQLFNPFKQENQAPTEASSQFNGQCFSINLSHKQLNNNEQQPSQKKQENKLKYRKLKQKLNNMGSTHDQKCVASKQIGGPSKQKILKLAIDFEKQVKIQNRDYFSLQSYSRQMLKYLQSKNEQELHILRQSRMMPAIFQLLQKVPMLHKNQFNQVLKTLELCLKTIELFIIINVNRDYLILTNRLNNLISLINWITGKEEKKSSTGNTIFYHVHFLCFKVVNVLLNHKCKQQNSECVHSIINTTLQLILCSQIVKKIKNTVCEQFIEDGQIQQTQLVQQMLKFLLIVLRKSHTKKDSIDSLLSQVNQFSVYNYLKINLELNKTIEFLLPYLVSYFIQVCQSENLDIEEDCISFRLSNASLNLLNLTIKILNTCFEISYLLFKKIFRQIQREPLFTNFLNKIYRLVIFGKKQYQEQDSNSNSKFLLNEIIVFLGYIGLQDPSMQRKVYETLIFEELSNLPIQFIMDPNLRQIIIPTICCLIHENKTNLNFLMKDNSPLHIIKFIRKQIQSRPTLQRKNSTVSLMSLTLNNIQSGPFSYETHRNQLSLRFPSVFWEQMCIQLQRHI